MRHEIDTLRRELMAVLASDDAVATIRAALDQRGEESALSEAWHAARYASRHSGTLWALLDVLRLRLMAAPDRAAISELLDSPTWQRLYAAADHAPATMPEYWPPAAIGYL